jgi:diguanylate cyclase
MSPSEDIPVSRTVGDEAPESAAPGPRSDAELHDPLRIRPFRQRLVRGVVVVVVALTALSSVLSLRFADTLARERESALLGQLVQAGLGAPESDATIAALRSRSTRHFERETRSGALLEWGFAPPPHATTWAALTPSEGSARMLTASTQGQTREMIATTVVQLVVGGGVIAWLTFWAGIVVTRSATERLQASSQALLRASTHDGQTGLPRRAHFLASMPSPAEAATGAVITIQIADHDGVGDTLGVAAADALVLGIADRIEQAVPRRTRVGRARVDTLITWTPGLSPDEALTLAELLRSQLGGAMSASGFSLLPTLRLGVAVRPLHGQTAEELVARASRATRSEVAAHAGIAAYDPSFERDLEWRYRMRPRLQTAIERGIIALHYQPKVDGRTGRTVGVEALARWTDEEEGVVRPDHFIALAEQTGMIQALTLHALEVAARQAVLLREAGLECPIAVNLSAVCFSRPNLVDEIVEVLLKQDLYADALQFEVTETAALNDPRRAREQLTRLRNVGFRVAMDDFGTGHSSLAQLADMPFDDVKIDQAFIRPLDASAPNDDPGWRLVAAIVHLASTLGLGIVAEGVEDAGVGTRLGAMGCQSLQGWAYAKALPADLLLARLQSERQTAAPALPRSPPRGALSPLASIPRT